jgi:hypothetical protein
MHKLRVLLFGILATAYSGTFQAQDHPDKVQIKLDLIADSEPCKWQHKANIQTITVALKENKTGVMQGLIQIPAAARGDSNRKFIFEIGYAIYKGNLHEMRIEVIQMGNEFYKMKEISSTVKTVNDPGDFRKIQSESHITYLDNDKDSCPTKVGFYFPGEVDFLIENGVKMGNAEAIN